MNNAAVCSIIVTYGERGTLLMNVVNSVIKEGVGKIIIVDNNSGKKSKEIIKDLVNQYSDKIKVIHLKKNMGSAGGFKAGLQEFLNENFKFAWLLDDDNVPVSGSLHELIKNYKKLSEKYSEVVVVSYRKSYKIIFNMPHNKLNVRTLEKDWLPKNRFNRFHILDAMRRILKSTHMLFKDKSHNNFNECQLVELPVAQYGGLLIKKDILQKYGFPNEKFFVYKDDTEWTYRLYVNGVKIFLVLSSKIEDIDKSFNASKSNFMPKRFLDNLFLYENDMKIYYRTRNQIAFEKNYLIENKLIYSINKCIFLHLISPILYSVAPYSYGKKDRERIMKRIKLIKKAIYDGEFL